MLNILRNPAATVAPPPTSVDQVSGTSAQHPVKLGVPRDKARNSIPKLLCFKVLAYVYLTAEHSLRMAHQKVCVPCSTRPRLKPHQAGFGRTVTLNAYTSIQQYHGSWRTLSSP